MTEPVALPRGRRALQLLPVLAALLTYGESQGRWIFAVPLLLLLVVVWAVRWQPASGFLSGLFSGIAGAGIGLSLASFSEPQTVALPPTPTSIIAGGLATLATYYAMCASPVGAWTAAWALGAVSLQVPHENTGLTALLLAATLVPSFVMGQSNWSARPRQFALVGFLVLLIPFGVGLQKGILGFDHWLQRRMEQLFRDIEGPRGFGMEPAMSADPLSDANLSEQVIMELDGPPPERLRAAVLPRLTLRKNVPLWSNSEFAIPGQPRQAPQRILPPPQPPEDQRRQLEIIMAEPLAGTVPTPAGSFGMTGAPNRLESGWIWRTNGPIQTPLSISRSAVEELPKEADPGALTELPDGYKAIFEPIARGIVGDASTAGEKAQRVERFFHANFLYSLHSDLRPKDGDQRNVLQILIEDRRPAFCIYFASAMGVLLRSLDVKARVVQGFLPDEYNSLTGRTTVRSRDAHAWVEAYLPEEGRFVRFDPTPMLSRDQLMGGHQQRGALANMADAVASFFRRTWIAIRADPVGFGRRLALHPVTWTIFIALVLWRAWTGRKDRKRQRRRTALGAAEPALKAAAARYARLLDRAGVMPDASMSDEERAQLLDASARPSAMAYLELYRRARFGGQPVSADDLDQALDALEQAVRAASRRAA